MSNQGVHGLQGRQHFLFNLRELVDGRSVVGFMMPTALGSSEISVFMISFSQFRTELHFNG